MTESNQQLLRQLPSVSEFLSSEPGRSMAAEFGEGLLKLELRARLEALRSEVLTGRRGDLPDRGALAASLRARLVRTARPEGRRVINATGVLLHPGLGRAPLCDRALEALAGCGRGTVLGTDPESGHDSPREGKVERLLRELTGCGAAAVVNNNAAATMLVLNTLAAGREVIVSRGQLVEIDGSFRLPEVIARSGAVMRQVGTTNRTHLDDYAGAIGEATGAILHVHPSNYRVRGFAGTPGIAELGALGRERSVPVIDDLGSGALVPLSRFGLRDEPQAGESIAAGADACCFSGDELICGPQSGIVCGRRETVARVRENPLARTFRVCKLTLAALEATLVHFVNGDYPEKLPFYRMLSRSEAELEETARRIAAELSGLPGAEVTVREDLSYVDRGFLPDRGVPTRTVALRPRLLSAGDLARRLRTGIPSVFARVGEDELLLDVRTVFADEEEALLRRLREVLA
jgi:L-seryl-tRNA(Ser) seleniumtransferase